MASNSTYLMNEELLKLLECHVCLKPMAPPIIQCKNGHNVCHGCRKHLDHCATCQENFVEIRNRLAEDLALKLPYPCENSDVGCKLTVLGSELENHGRLCPYRIYGCALKQEQSCIWTGRKIDVLKHIKVDHLHYLVEDRVIKFKWSIKEENNSKRVISTLGEVFVFVRKSENRYVSFYVQYLGDDSKRIKFRYHVELKSSDNVHNVSFSSVPVSDLKSEREILDSGEYITLSPGLCDLLAHENKEILYELKITSTEFCPSDDVKFTYDDVE